MGSLGPVESSVVVEGPESFGERFAASEQFDLIFRQGMRLVERTAAYLEGSGRKDSKRLSPAGQLAYASESMRLTTRLLELASWLLIRRGLNSGEIDLEEARQKRRRLRLVRYTLEHVRNLDDLPQGLRGLMTECSGLTERILLLDRVLSLSSRPPVAAAGVNPVADQMARLSAAFGRA